MLLRGKKNTDELHACNSVGQFQNNYAEWKKPEIKISLYNLKTKQNKSSVSHGHSGAGEGWKREIKKGNEEIFRRHGYVHFLSQPLAL